MAEPKLNSRDIDLLIRAVQERMPEARVWQLQVCHPADDDNLWWFYLPGIEDDIQIEGAALPFLVETNEQSSGEALTAATIEDAVTMIVTYLTAARDGTSVRLTA